MARKKYTGEFQDSAVKQVVCRHKFSAAILAVLAFALLLRLAWGWHARRQLAAALDDLRRRGQPTDESEFFNETLPDSENAWNLYGAAIRSMKPNVYSPRNSALDYPPYPPYGTQWDALAAASETVNAGAFPLARQARRLPRSQVPLATRQFPGGYSSKWSAARSLANTVIDGAQYAHLRGDDAEAVERLLDVLHLGRSIRQDPTIVGQLVGIGVDALACDGIQHVAPTLRLDPSAGTKPATAAQARQLIAALLDETPNREWLARAMGHERVQLPNLVTTAAADTWAIRPLAYRSNLRWLNGLDALVGAASSASAQEARRVGRSLEGQNPDPPHCRYSRWFDVAGPENLARIIEQFHRGSAERRATAFIVAARLYRQDNGRWPERAADLVPNYLDAIPADPFRDGGPLGYVVQEGTLPDGGDRPLVYFESGDPGFDMIDVELMYGWQTDYWIRIRNPGTPRHEVRQYRDVSYWLSKTRRFDQQHAASTNPSTQAVNDDPDEPDAPGDDANKDRAPGDPPGQ